jgi:hypothetical protein
MTTLGRKVAISGTSARCNSPSSDLTDSDIWYMALEFRATVTQSVAAVGPLTYAPV